VTTSTHCDRTIHTRRVWAPLPANLPLARSRESPCETLGVQVGSRRHGRGRGIGRSEHWLAREGARVVVNDVGRPTLTPDVLSRRGVAEIESFGGTAVATRDVSDRPVRNGCRPGDRLVRTPGCPRQQRWHPAQCDVDEMSIQDWDAVIRVTCAAFPPAPGTALYWRERVALAIPSTPVINTSSGSASLVSPDRATTRREGGGREPDDRRAQELEPIGVTVNALCRMRHAMTLTLRSYAKEPVEGWDPRVRITRTLVVCWPDGVRT